MEIPNITKKRITKYLAEGKRFDNRNLLNHRDISIDVGVSKNAEGSARVRIGKTEIIAGVKLNVMEPFTDTPENGVLIVIAELLPMSAERFEPGPPRIEAIELARIVDRGIRESGFIDLSKLCIKKGEKVWGIFLDLYSINDSGNLLDAACLAAVAALKNAKIPKYDEKKEKVKYGELTTKKLPLTKSLPFTMTFHKIGDSIFLDPVVEEEESSEARLSIAMSEKNMINAMQKGNEAALTKQEIFKILEIAEKKFNELYPKILKKIEGK